MANNHFAKDLSVEEIKSRIIELTNHKAITEIDLLLQELEIRRRQFKYRIISEMMVNKI